MKPVLVWLVLFTVVSAVTPVYAQRSYPRLGTATMRASSDVNTPAVWQYGPNDTFYVTADANTIPPGTRLDAQWRGPRGENVGNSNFTLDKPYSSVWFRLSRKQGPWPPGSYNVDLFVNGRFQQRAHFTVDVRAAYQRPTAPTRAEQRRYTPPRTEGRAAEIAGEWTAIDTDKGVQRTFRMTIQPGGECTSGFDGSNKRTVGLIQAARGRYVFRATTSQRNSTGSYRVSAEQLVFTPDGLKRGERPTVLHRAGSAAEAATNQQTPSNEPPPPSPSEQPPPVTQRQPSRQTRVAAPRLDVVRTYRSFDKSGGHDPTESFVPTDTVWCVFSGSFRTGTEVVARWRDGDTTWKKPHRSPRDGTYTGAIPVRPPTGDWLPGNYSVDMLVDGRPVKTVSFKIEGQAVATVQQTAGKPERDLTVERRKPPNPQDVKKARGNGRRFALLIGVSKYENPEITPLRFTLNDVEALRKVLTDPNLGGIPAANIKVLTDATPEKPTMDAVGKALNWLNAMADRPGDTVIIYFSGHGYNDQNGSYLLTVESNPSTLLMTGLNISIFNKAVEAIPARKKIIVLDACHSGGMSLAARGDGKATPEMLRAMQKEAEGEARFLSCSNNESSYEEPTYNQGVFTYFLVKGMRGEADANHDGIVTFEELEEYVKVQVRRYAAERGRSQTPVADVHHTGVIIMTDKGR